MRGITRTEEMPPPKPTRLEIPPPKTEARLCLYIQGPSRQARATRQCGYSAGSGDGLIGFDISQIVEGEDSWESEILFIGCRPLHSLSDLPNGAEMLASC